MLLNRRSSHCGVEKSHIQQSQKHTVQPNITTTMMIIHIAVRDPLGFIAVVVKVLSKAQVGHPRALTAVVVLLSVDPNMVASGQRVLVCL